MRTFLTAVVVGLAAYVATVGNRVSVAESPAPEKVRQDPNAGIPPHGIAMHEWGTFTSFSGSNGVPVSFQPDNSSLPGFVYHHGGKSYSKSNLLLASGTVSMETPVIYFYTDREVQASVRVGFPKGWITEWYPHAASPPDGTSPRPASGESIGWDVRLVPGEPLRPDNGIVIAGLPVGTWTIEYANGVRETCEIRRNGVVLAVEPQRSASGKAEVKDGAVSISFEDDRFERWKQEGNHFAVEHWPTSAQFPAGTPVPGTASEKKDPNPYFRARETDAVPVQTTFELPDGNAKELLNGGAITQREKFLFYRGVGTFPPPVSVRAEGGGMVRVTNAAGGRLTGMVLVTVRDGRVGFQAVNDLEAGAEAVAALPEIMAGPEALGAAMEKALRAAGLYEREAQAMVKTWEHAWFHEEGARLLYILPRAKTDELLPLSISPKPTEVVRVIVGRHDFLTPEQEAAVERQLKRQQSARLELQQAEAELARVGRFSQQAKQMVLDRLTKATQRPMP